MACFADINVSLGSVATYARCGGTFTIHLTANLPRIFQWKKILKWVKNWQNYGHEFVATFLAHPVELFYLLFSVEPTAPAGRELRRIYVVDRGL